MRKSGRGKLAANDSGPSPRLPKLESLLRSELGGLLERELELPPNALLTVTTVTVLPDLSQARIGVSVLPVAKAKLVFNILAKAVSTLQRLVNQRLKLYRVPRLNFYLDRSLEQAERLDRLLDSLKTKE